MVNLAEKDRRGAALLARADARNTLFGLSLSVDSRMTYQPSKDYLRWGDAELRLMKDRKRSWITRALFKWSLCLQSLAASLFRVRVVHRAMMFSTPPAAGRQIRFALRRQGEERRKQRQAEKGKQRDGQKLTQWCY